MNQLLMQPKIYNLRLNIEQTTHIVDGMAENRKHVEEESLPLYDSQFADVLDQFKMQDLNFIIDLEDQDTSDDAELAQHALNDIKSFILDMSADQHEKGILMNKVKALETIIFGE